MKEKDLELGIKVKQKIIERVEEVYNETGNYPLIVLLNRHSFQLLSRLLFDRNTSTKVFEKTHDICLGIVEMSANDLENKIYVEVLPRVE